MYLEELLGLAMFVPQAFILPIHAYMHVFLSVFLLHIIQYLAVYIHLYQSVTLTLLVEVQRRIEGMVWLVTEAVCGPVGLSPWSQSNRNARLSYSMSQSMLHDFTHA
jgi:hypothetical protein